METKSGPDEFALANQGRQRATRRKAMETWKTRSETQQVSDVANGRRAERQWRLCFPITDFKPQLMSPTGDAPKGNGDLNSLTAGVLSSVPSPTGDAPKGNGDFASSRVTLPNVATSPTGDAPKGNGDVSAEADRQAEDFVANGRHAERQWRHGRSGGGSVLRGGVANGRRAERQWRHRTAIPTMSESGVANGRRAERQWRLGRLVSETTPYRRSPTGDAPKGNGDWR